MPPNTLGVVVRILWVTNTCTLRVLVINKVLSSTILYWHPYVTKYYFFAYGIIKKCSPIGKIYILQT